LRLARAVVALFAFAVPLSLASTASAEYQGTPGKVAYIGTGPKYPLKLWDPVEADWEHPQAGQKTLVEETFHFPGQQEVVLGERSTPVFSPDGTRIAFSALVQDKGVKAPAVGWHTAIFVWNLKTGTKEQITHPDETLLPPEECEHCVGHTVADYMPTWSPDGHTIAFIRQVAATDYDTLKSVRGENIWEVAATGGTPTKLTNGGTQVNYESVVWGQKGMVTAFADENGQELGHIPEGSNAPVVIASPGVVLDYDISPDGETVTYVTLEENVDEHIVGIDGSNDGVQHSGLTSPMVRFSNTGNGPLRPDCDTVPKGSGQITRCGIFEEHLDEPDRDYRSDEPPDRFMLAWIDSAGAFGGGTRSLWDVQAQQLPVIFIPGFLGSEIVGCGETQWFTVPPDLLGMRLDASGEANFGCPTSTPDGKLVTFYEKTAEWIEQNFGEGVTPFHCERANTFGWDWRKTPKPSLASLNLFITEALAKDECAEKEGAGRVVIEAHSYGGLLTRTFLSEPKYAKRVARVLTVGTPYWGSPKSVFPPAFGIEMPYVLDNMIFNEDNLKAFSDNLAGLMQLFPSPRFGPWLTVDGNTLDRAGVRGFLESVGANGALFENAQSLHEQIYDNFFTNYGTIDYRQVVGTGKVTPKSVKITHLVGDLEGIKVEWANGDETVPARSATTGEIGSQPEDKGVHIQDICEVGHMAETDSPQVRDNYIEFLDYGRAPKRTKGPCEAHGGLLDFRYSTGHLGPPRSVRSQGAATRAGGEEVLTLEQAYLENLIDLYSVPGEQQAVLDPTKPVTVGGTAEELEFTFTQLSGQGDGDTYRYGPLSGQLAISAGAGPLEVTLDGQPVSGELVKPPQEEESPPGGGPSGSGPPPSSPPGSSPHSPCSTLGGKAKSRCLARLRCKHLSSKKKRQRCLAKLRRHHHGKRPH
jgi:pimeloyl-ACP methyl ester carboxylesterase